MAPVSAGKTAGGPASKARLTKPAFTPLKTSSAAVSPKTAFTALEPSFTTVFPETSLLMLKTSFAAVSSKAAFTALEPSFTSLFSETGLAAQAPIPAAAAEAISTTMKISAAVTGTEAGISPEISIFLDFTFILRLHKTSLHFRSRFIRIPSFKIFRIKHIIIITACKAPCMTPHSSAVACPSCITFNSSKTVTAYGNNYSGMSLTQKYISCVRCICTVCNLMF